MISKERFIKYFDNNFWKAINRSGFFEKFNNKDKKELLHQVFSSIIARSYYPSTPTTVIIANKNLGVPRLIPVFDIKDYIVYFYCIKQIEEFIAINRIPNTYGGWTIGGLIRRTKEEKEYREKLAYLKDYESLIMNIYGVSIPSSSYNPAAWAKAYGQYNSVVKSTLEEGVYKYVIELDIANFYDCIRLDILENQIISKVNVDFKEEVSLLFHLLSYWNRANNFYNPQTVGLPQDALNDCSRILANSYLSEYDEFMFQETQNLQTTYIRYADDQLIFGNNKDDLKKLVLFAGVKLNTYGLRINQKKVSIKSVEAFYKERSFNIFAILEDPGATEHPEFVKKYVDEVLRVCKDSPSKKSSLLKRSLSCKLSLIDSNLRKKLYTQFTKSEILSLKKYQLQNIYNKLCDTIEYKKEFIQRLKDMGKELIHTAFLYEVRAFFISIEEDITLINYKIQEIEKMIYKKIKPF